MTTETDTLPPFAAIDGFIAYGETGPAAAAGDCRLLACAPGGDAAEAARVLGRTMELARHLAPPGFGGGVAALWEGGACLVQPASGRGVLGARGFNLGLAMRGLAEGAPAGTADDAAGDAPQAETPDAEAPVALPPGPEAALWELADLIERTELPRRLRIMLGDDALTLAIARGAAWGDSAEAQLSGLAARLRAALGSGAGLRYRLEPDPGAAHAGPPVDAAALFRGAHDAGRSSEESWAFNAAGWPDSVPTDAQFSRIRKETLQANRVRAWAKFVSVQTSFRFGLLTPGAAICLVVVGDGDGTVRIRNPAAPKIG